MKESDFASEICSARFFQTVTTHLKTIHFVSFSVDAVQGLCSSGPTEFTKGKSGRIDCDFKNFAMQKVLWYKGKKLLTNGSQGLHQVSRQVSVDTFRSSLLFPILRFDHAGFYTCKQEPAPPNSRCPKGKIKEIFVTCKCSSIAVKEIHGGEGVGCRNLVPRSDSFLPSPWKIWVRD